MKNWRMSVVKYYEERKERVPDLAATTRILNLVTKHFAARSDADFFDSDNIETIRAALNQHVTPTGNITQRVVTGLQYALDNPDERKIILEFTIQRRIRGIHDQPYLSEGTDIPCDTNLFDAYQIKAPVKSIFMNVPSLTDTFKEQWALSALNFLQDKLCPADMPDHDGIRFYLDDITAGKIDNSRGHRCPLSIVRFLDIQASRYKGVLQGAMALALKQTFNVVTPDVCDTSLLSQFAVTHGIGKINYHTSSQPQQEAHMRYQR